MLGYIVPDKPELKIREFEIYSGYYCGICRSIGKRHGQIPRLSLSYDSVFLALIIAGLTTDKEQLRFERCIVHPMKKRPTIIRSTAVDFAADMHLLMAYHKLKDDGQDDRNPASLVGARLMKGMYRSLKVQYPDIASAVEIQLGNLSRMEKEGVDLIDRAAEPYALMMGEIFKRAPDYVDGFEEFDQSQLASVGFHLGKWVYTIDALDDIENDIKKKSYNPLLRQFDYEPAIETGGIFRARIAERIEFSLLYCLAEMSRALERLDIRKNRELIENIVFLGLHRKTEEVLKKGRSEGHAESI